MRSREFIPSSQELTKEELKNLANKWQERAEVAINYFFEKEKLSREELFQILWDQCILERVNPLNEKEKNARHELQKAVYCGARDDAELYMRIMYSAIAAEEAIEQKNSIVLPAYGYITGITQGIFRSLREPASQKQLYPELVDNPQFDIYGPVLDYIKNKAEQIIKDLNPDQPLTWLHSGAKGNWHGIDVEVNAITHDGLVYLNPQSFEPAQAHALYTEAKAAGFNGTSISPGDINPNNFTK